MHTDEYEISIGREINLCGKLIRRLKRSLEKKEKQYGLSTADFLNAFDQGRLAHTNPDFVKWRVNFQEIQDLELMVSQYIDELKKLN